MTSQPKIYFSDTGILQKLGKGKSSGQIFENAVANQLARLGQLNYFEKSKSKEIDFVFDEITAFEVKETPSLHHLNSLRFTSGQIGINDCKLIGRYPAGSGFNDFIWGGNIF